MFVDDAGYDDVVDDDRVLDMWVLDLFRTHCTDYHSVTRLEEAILKEEALGMMMSVIAADVEARMFVFCQRCCPRCGRLMILWGMLKVGQE
jgi:hypothetical protein